MLMFFLLRLIEGVGLLLVRPLFGLQLSFSFKVIERGLKVTRDWADIAVGYFPMALPPVFLTGTNEDSCGKVLRTTLLGGFFWARTLLASSSIPYEALSLVKVVMLLAMNFQLASGSLDLHTYLALVSASFLRS
jgi:hypothetical protein